MHQQPSAGFPGAHPPPARSIEEVGQRNRRIEALWAQARDASEAYGLLSQTPAAPQARIDKAAERLEEAVGELRSLGVIV